MKQFGKLTIPGDDDVYFENPDSEIKEQFWIEDNITKVARAFEKPFVCTSCIMSFQSIERVTGHLNSKHKDILDLEEIDLITNTKIKRKVEEAYRRCKLEHDRYHPDCHICNLNPDQ